MATSYIVLERAASGSYFIIGRTEALGPEAAAKKLNQNARKISFLVVPVRNASFVDLDDYTPPTRIKTTLRSLDDVLGQTSIPVDEPGPAAA